MPPPARPGAGELYEQLHIIQLLWIFTKMERLRKKELLLTEMYYKNNALANHPTPTRTTHIRWRKNNKTPPNCLPYKSIRTLNQITQSLLLSLVVYERGVINVLSNIIFIIMNNSENFDCTSSRISLDGGILDQRMLLYELKK